MTGPGGGGGTGPAPCTGSGCTTEPGAPSPETASEDDYISPMDTVPNCTVVQSAAWADAYCRATVPSGARADTINAALNRIEQRGGECATIAAQGRTLLAAGRLKVFAPQSGDTGGWGDSDIGVLIADYWVDHFSSTVTSDNRNLDLSLSHEIEHSLGRSSHVDAGGYDTLNSRTCSGLSGTSP